jgi:hypothetical protein
MCRLAFEEQPVSEVRSACPRFSQICLLKPSSEEIFILFIFS